MQTNDPLLLRHENAAELFLIRHGDAVPGADEIVPADNYDNLPLSKVGRQQAQQLAERLRRGQFAAAYSSPLLRCQETAAPLLDYLKLQPTIIEDIQEVQSGNVIEMPDIKTDDDLELLTRALNKRLEEIARLVGASGSWDSIKGAESSKGFRRRVVRALDEIAQRHIGEHVLVFAHGGTINAYAAEVLGLEKEFFFPCANTSITVVRVAKTQRVLFVLNDIGHLQRA